MTAKPMTLVRCPHCGARNFGVTGWVDLDHCSRCGKPLSDRAPRAVEERVRERLYGGRAQRRSVPSVGRKRGEAGSTKERGIEPARKAS